ncbi:acyl-CoA dehydrogenase family protein [Sulfitobacter aestuarii]|uniref:Acyl-CoA dehydrogenase family protein n=1 Tax=Sulfitobacter aestuarii TaxID=2161676 RepID=A0ABW5TZ33_9RHOB
MRLGTTEEDIAVADMVARFAPEQLGPKAAELDESEASCTCHLPGLAELGVMGMNLPEAWGGPGVSPVAMILSLVEIAKHCASTASMIGAQYLATDSILIGGDDAQRARWLPDAAAGRTLGGFALTEPRGGSNPADITTKAVREGEGYRITGAKQFISNAGEADFLVVYAKTDPDAGHRGISAFVVETKQGGVTVDKPEKLMGIRAAHAFAVTLDVWVPLDSRLGEEGTGFKTAMKVLDNSRLDVAGTCLGLSEAAFAAAAEHMGARQVGGHPIGDFQGLQFMLADMKLRLEASWGLTMQALANRMAGERYTLEASLAKLHASETAAFVTDRALQIHGGYGFTRELPLERYARDARIMRIYEGSSEIQRSIIARQAMR